MIWILLSIGYVAIAYLYAEAVWNSPEVKEALEEIYSLSPGVAEGRLGLVKLLIALFWPVFLFGGIGAYTLQVLGIIKPGGEEE